MPELPRDLRRLTELDAARAEGNPGVRLDAIRRAGRLLRERLAGDGTALGVRTYPIATFPYPTRYALSSLARSPAPYVMMRNALQIVQVEGDGGRRITILVNPSEPERSREAPFFSRQIERYGELVATRLLSKVHGTLPGALADAGIRPEDVDYVTFDHLHVQDVRGLFGTTEPEPGKPAPTPAFLPNARLLVQRAELRTLACLHPLQTPWYVKDAIRGVPRDRFVELDGDYAIGGGFALVRTPGHTWGNHSVVVVTDRGAWTISENGVCVDAYAPHASDLPGLRRAAREQDLEVVLNANTREGSLDQYTSMVLEKTLADPSAERPEFPQHFASSEMVRSVLAPGLAPTFSHGVIEHGRIEPATPATGARGAA
jgi:glyoxylase-like metal-dependent hydrolase (beta-lactamase superfamily II)